MFFTFFIFKMFLCFFNVVFLLLLKHKRCVACCLVRVRHTPFPGKSECFAEVLLTLFDSYLRCFLLQWIL